MAELGDLLGGKYRLIRSIGKGGMGEVFEARHVELDKRVAIKVPTPELLEDEKNLERFKREPRVAAATGHRGIVDVYDIGTTEDGVPFVVMEYLEGESFADMIDRQGKVEIATAIYIIAQVLSALDAAHAKGIIHRDLKPENVYLVHSGQSLPEVKLLDFGTSKVVAGSGDNAPRLTQSGTILGTPYYMAPEQIRGARHLDARLDVYAVGVSFYEAVTGQVPFDSENLYTLVHKVLHDELIPPRVFNGDVSPELEQVILKAMDRDRDRRFGSALEMLQALLPFMDDLILTRVSIPEQVRASDPKLYGPPSQRSPEPPSFGNADTLSGSDDMGRAPTQDADLSPVMDQSLVLGRYAPTRRLLKTESGTEYFGTYESTSGGRRPVCIEVIPGKRLADPMAVRSFVQEARLASRLIHPNIAQILDYGEHAGRYVIVTEYVHGYRLEAILEHLAASGRPLSLEHALYVTHNVLLGLGFAHGMTDELGEPLGLVHGAVSAKSVRLGVEGQIKVNGFASASAISGDRASGGEEEVGPCAPEQLTGGDFDHRVDLYAVGVLLFRMLTGRTPFEQGSDGGGEPAGAPEELRRLRPDLPAEVSQVIARALAADPAERYQNAASFNAALRYHLGTSTPGEIEPSFRDMLNDTLSDPAFRDRAGELLDLPKALKGDSEPIELPVEETAETEVPEAVQRGGKTSVGLLIALVAALVMISGVAVGISLYVLSDRDRGRSEPDRPLALIINQQSGDAAAPEPGEPIDSEEAVVQPGDADTTPGIEVVPEAGPGEAPGDEEPGRSPSRPLPELSGELVTRRLMRRQAQLIGCIRSHGDSSPGRPIVAIRLVIDRGGRVTSASVEPADLEGTALGRCIDRVARSIRFPQHSGPSATFRVPVRLARE